MKIIMQSKKLNYKAIAEYDIKTKQVTILKGSTVAAKVNQSATFRGTNRIIQLRAENVVDNVLQNNITFKSLSSSSNFIAGQSTNGLIKWKTEDGQKIKDYIASHK